MNSICQTGCNICTNINTSENFSQENKINWALKEQLRDIPYNILLKPTHNCNIKCTYCYDRIAQKKHGKGVMTIERAKKIIDMVKADPRPCAIIIFHGGEPLLAGIDWYREIFKYAKEQIPNIKLSIQSNGTLLNEEYLDLFKEYGVEIGLSYDLYPDDLPKNKWYRPNIPLKKLKRLVEYDRKTTPHVINGFISVISSINYKNLPSAIIKSKETELKPALNFLFPTEEMSLTEETFYSYEEYANELKNLLLFYLSEYDSVDVERSILHLTSMLHGGSFSCCNRKNCSYGWVGIGPNGEMAHCDTYTYGKYYLGMMDDYKHITDMHYTENYNNIVNDKKRKRLANCSRCPLSDICKGTCFANSLNDEGNDMIFDSNACNELQYALFGLYQIFRNYNVFSFASPDKECIIQKQLITNDFYTMWEINEVIKKTLGVDLYMLDEHALDSPYRLFRSKEFKIFRLFNPSEATDDVVSQKPITNRVINYNTVKDFNNLFPDCEKVKLFLKRPFNVEETFNDRQLSIKYALIKNLGEIKEILNK